MILEHNYNRLKWIWRVVRQMNMKQNLNVSMKKNLQGNNYIWKIGLKSHSGKLQQFNPYPAEEIHFATPISDCQPIR